MKIDLMKIDEKEKIIENTVLSLDSNEHMEKLKHAHLDIVEFIADMHNVFMPVPYQIYELKKIVEMMIHEKEYADFFGSREIIAPLIEKFKKEDMLLFSDIRRYVRVIGHATTYEEAHELGLKLLKILEYFSAQKLYKGVKVGIHLNLLVRFTRSKYERVDGKLNKEMKDRLDELFNFHYDALDAIFDPEKISVYKAVAIIRRGIYFREVVKDRHNTKDGFKALEKAGRSEMYKQLFEEAQKSGLYSKDTQVPDYISHLGREAKMEGLLDYLRGLTDGELNYVDTAIRNLIDLRYRDYR